MKKLLRPTTTTLHARPRLPERLAKGLFGTPKDTRTYSVQVADVELRRSGHMSTNVPDLQRIREEFRSIKRRVVSHLSDGRGVNGRDPRVILVSSARPLEGKTFVAINLALSLALDRNLDVTLIDGDVTNAGLSVKFNLGRSNGLLDVLESGGSGSADAARDTNIENLRVVPAGQPRPDGTELLSSEHMVRYLDSIVGDSASRVVVIDSGSLLSESAPASLASVAGQVLFVIASNETGRGAINDALSLLDGQIGPLETANLGLVLNKISSGHSTVRYSGSAA